MTYSNQDVLIIVLNYNGEEFIEDCLSSIRDNTIHPEKNYDILIVDNNSNDDSVNIAEDFGDVIIENKKNLGYDIANNIAIYENPSYDYYTLLNNDTKVKQGWLSTLIDTAENKKAGVVGPKILNSDEKSIQSAGLYRNEGWQHVGEDASEFNEVKKCDTVHGSAWVIRRELFEDIGYLDEIFSLGNGEEWDYCSRARKAGYDVYVDGNAEIIHYGSKTKEKMGSKLMYFLYTKNSLKDRIMNESAFGVLEQLGITMKKLLAGFVGYGDNPINAWWLSVKEVIIDLPYLLKKRYNREDYIPSYYCEGIKDYSKRYEDLEIG